MVNYKPDRTDMGLWVICSAVGDDHDKVKQMQKNEDGTYPIKFSVGGVELDFNKVIKRLDEDLDKLVERKAQKLIESRYDDLIKDIHDIQERLEYHKDKLKYDWEDQKYYVNILVYDIGDDAVVPYPTSIVDSIEDGLKLINDAVIETEKPKSYRYMLASSIDTYDKDNVKTTVFHDLYIKPREGWKSPDKIDKEE